MSALTSSTDRSRHQGDPPLPADTVQDRVQLPRGWLPVGPFAATQRRGPVPPVLGPRATAVYPHTRLRSSARRHHLVSVLVQFVLLTAAQDGRGDLGEHLRPVPPGAMQGGHQ